MLSLRCGTAEGTDGRAWLRVTLARVHCIDQVVWYTLDGSIWVVWNCSSTACSCQGDGCSRYTLTVSSVGASSEHFPLVTDCKYGDSVQIERTDGLGYMWVQEIAITAKEGGIAAYGHFCDLLLGNVCIPNI